MQSARAITIAGLVVIAGLTSAARARAACGDGVVDQGETCDDGNASSADGCAESCQREDRYVCSGAPSTCCFADTGSAYALVGDASYDAESGEITLVPALTFRTGAAWFRTPLDLTRPFSLEFALYLGDRDDNPRENTTDTGADGIALLLQRDPRGVAALGAPGTAMGQYGSELGALDIAPVLGVEFDTYNNKALYGDATSGDEDHISVFHTRATPAGNHLTSAVCMNDAISCQNYEDGSYHAVAVRWTGNADHHLQVWFDGLRRIDLDVDLVGTYFAGQASGITFGFAAGTGGSYNAHKICPRAPVDYGQETDADAGVPAEVDAGGEAPSASDAGVPDGVAMDAGLGDAASGTPRPDAGATLEPSCASPLAPSCPGADSDGDQVPNRTDEAPSDPCRPAMHALACAGGDADGDGLPNALECAALPSCRDTDADGVPDYLDTDSDGDGLTDRQECATPSACPDSDGDGTADVLAKRASESGGCALGAGRTPVPALTVSELLLALLISRWRRGSARPARAWRSKSS